VKRATIKDVALAAGVDVSTVSRAIHGNTRISAETRDRVAVAIRDLDYRPNVAARAMVTRKTHTFGFLVPDLSDPNVAEFATGAEARAREDGFSMVVAGYSPRDSRNRPDASFFREHRVDGILLMSPRHYPADAFDLPVATLEEARVDNRGGGGLVGELLRALGHRIVAFLGGQHDSPHARERVLGLQSTLDGEVIVRYGDWSAESGRALTTSLLTERADVTAIFAASDSVALGVIHALHASGVVIPRDVSVVGFDDQAVSRHCWPALTTVSQPLRAVGATAFGLLRQRIAGHEPDPAPPLPVHLIERDSTAPARSR
jgi:DNA-binding LacI/PurR family transcriptional regulator